jgi:glycosyltransferase involved in cell wall biosynthesis
LNSIVYINARFLTQKTSGVQRFAIELAIRLKKMYPHFIFVSPNAIFHVDLAKKLEVVTVGNFNSHIWEQIELPLFLKSKGSPLLINFCNTAPLFYSNQIVTIHDVIFHLHPEWFSSIFAKWYNYLIPKIAQKAKLVLTVSENAKTDICKYFNVPKESVSVIYNAVNESFQIPNEDGLKKKPYILAVSSLDPRKNFENLIKAYLSLDKIELDLIIVGAESASFPKHHLFEEVKNNQKIKFTGYVTDEELVRFYQEATLFVYPSLYEGFGIPPLEAMACGTPVIVANNSSLPEVCSDAAIYTNEHDYKDIAQKINLLIENIPLQQDLIQLGLKRVKCFSWDSSAEKVLLEIKKLKI